MAIDDIRKQAGKDACAPRINKSVCDMKKLRTPFVCLLALLPVAVYCLWSPSATAAATKQVVWYKIDAQLKLDDREHPVIIEGRETLTWLNDSTDRISELQFHLYLNAFKNEKSTFFRESGGQLRNDRFEAGEWGWIDVKEMRIAGGEDLTSKIEFIHPDDDNADDQSVIRVPLARPVGPGEKIVLDVVFNARLPRVFARSGYWGSFAMVGQWFPKIGVWEAVGERRRHEAGWNCHQYHAHSEFYADFGVYDVTVTVPPVYKDKVGATGSLRSERVNQDGTVTYNFYQEDVHDFAWSVDKNFVKVVRTFKPDEHVTAGEIEEWSRILKLPAEQIRLKDMTVTLLIQNENRGQIDRHFKAAFNAIKYFGLWYGVYPYGTLTIIDPPYNGGGAGGMEYPTLITAGTRWRPGLDQNPEEVVVHEFGHQYWYGLVATNEFEESWLDEGFNTYSTGKVLGQAYGPAVIPFSDWSINWFYFPVEVPHPLEDRLLTLQGKFNDPILTPAWKFYDSFSYGVNSYPRTGLTLKTLEGFLGPDVMAQLMRTYHQRWRFGHPTSEDFFDLANEVSGQDLDWFFDQFVRGTSTLDYEVAEAKSTPPDAEAGMYDREGKRIEVKEEDKESEQSSTYNTEIDVRRLGEAWFPVELLVLLKNGTLIRITPGAVRSGVIEYRIQNDADKSVTTDAWPITDRWKKFKFTTGSEIQMVQLDPSRKILLDANLTNNGRSNATGTKGALRWASGALFWLQSALQAISFFS